MRTRPNIQTINDLYSNHCLTITLTPARQYYLCSNSQTHIANVHTVLTDNSCMIIIREMSDWKALSAGPMEGPVAHSGPDVVTSEQPRVMTLCLVEVFPECLYCTHRVGLQHLGHD